MKLYECEFPNVYGGVYQKLKRMSLRFDIDIDIIANNMVEFTLEDTQYQFCLNKGRIRIKPSPKLNITYPWHTKIIETLKENHPTCYNPLLSNECIVTTPYQFDDTKSNKFFTKTNIFKFGKYKGFTYDYVNKLDAKYIEWCKENVENFKLFCPESI